REPDGVQRREGEPGPGRLALPLRAAQGSLRPEALRHGDVVQCRTVPDTLTPPKGMTAAARAKAPPRCAVLYVALHCDHPAAPPSRHLLADTEAVQIGRSRAVGALREGNRLQLSVADGWMSMRHAALTRSAAGWSIEDAGSRNGTLVNGAKCTRAELHDGDILELGHTLFLFRDPVPVSAGATPDLNAAQLPRPAAGLATFAPALATEAGRLGMIARSDVSVVIQGETGCGKEVAARALHLRSGRGGQVVAVDFGGIARTLVEVEMLGFRQVALSGSGEYRPGLVLWP